MKAISVRAPWWWFILHAGKDIENRDWHTNYRGTVLLHASKWWRPAEVFEDAEWAHETAERTKTLRYDMVYEDVRALGSHIVGKVDIVDCVNHSDSSWFFGDFGFVLANPVAFRTPIPCKGALGLFDVPKDVEYLIRQAGQL